MKMIFLVDGDNNIGTGLQGIDLLTAEDTVLVFFGKGQTLANVKKLCAGTKAQVQYLESVKGGKNSLDFQIITELGVLVGRGEADFAYVISQDKGYEAAMSALHARYASTFREVALRPSIQDCLQAAFLLRAGTREELAAALARQYGPVQGQLAYEHLEALLTPPPVQEAAAPSPAPEQPAQRKKGRSRTAVAICFGIICIDTDRKSVLPYSFRSYRRAHRRSNAGRPDSRARRYVRSCSGIWRRRCCPARPCCFPSCSW